MEPSHVFEETDMNRFRSAQGETTALDSKYLETITIHDRDYQRYAVEHNINLMPVDDVNEPWSFPWHSL